jgi:membrane fusion protein, multidrug efflux system
MSAAQSAAGAEPLTFPANKAAPAKTKTRSRKGRLIIGGVVAAAVLAGGGGALVHARAQHVYANDARIASHVVAVSSEASGRLVELAVNPGEKVRKGQLLARIEPRDAQFALAKIDAQIAAIEAQQAQLRVQQDAVHSRVASQVGVSTAGVSEAESAFQAQQAEVRAARSAFQRTRTLFDKGLVARSRYDEDLARLTAAEQSASRAQAGIAAAQAGVGVTRTGADEAAVMEEQIAVLEAQKRGLVADRAKQALDLDRREIRAAFDGVVDQTFVDAGEYVTPGARLLMYHARDDLWVDVNVKETEVRKLALGAPATVKVDAYPGQTFEAKVARIGGAATSQFALLPNPNPSGNFTKVTQRLPVRLELARKDARLRPGMMVEATIDVVD